MQEGLPIKEEASVCPHHLHHHSLPPEKKHPKVVITTIKSQGPLAKLRCVRRRSLVVWYGMVWLQST